VQVLEVSRDGELDSVGGDDLLAGVAEHVEGQPGLLGLNLAAELAGTGVTVNILRPGTVDTAMPAWIRAQPPAQIGAALHDRFMAMRESGVMAPPARPAGMIVNLLADEATGPVADAGNRA